MQPETGKRPDGKLFQVSDLATKTETDEALITLQMGHEFQYWYCDVVLSCMTFSCENT